MWAEGADGDGHRTANKRFLSALAHVAYVALIAQEADKPLEALEVERRCLVAGVRGPGPAPGCKKLVMYHLHVVWGGVRGGVTAA